MYLVKLIVVVIKLGLLFFKIKETTDSTISKYKKYTPGKIIDFPRLRNKFLNTKKPIY